MPFVCYLLFLLIVLSRKKKSNLFYIFLFFCDLNISLLFHILQGYKNIKKIHIHDLESYIT